MTSHLYDPSRPAPALSRRAVFTASSAIAAGLALTGASRKRRVPTAHAQGATEVTIALDWYPNANHAGLYMAQDRGYFTDAGLAVTLQVPADPTTVLQTVGAGRDTFGISYQTEILFARSQQIPVVSVAALVQHPLNSMMVLADSPIQRPGDLAGKRVAISGLPSDGAILETMLGADGLSTSDVEVIDVGYDLMPAVLSGRVDAVVGVYWTHETILAARQGTPVRFFRVEEWGVPDHYELILVAGESVVADQEAMVREVLGAIQRGYEDAIADPDEAISLLAAASPDLDAEVEREGIGLLAPVWTDSGAVAFGTQTEERWNLFGGWLKGQNLLDPDVDVAAAWRGDLLPEGSGATPVASPVATPI
ncbi:MAG: ABC transporter substrate-binding protein [Chloroflexia bacterium]|nr:ABC transporter substrate-binding protein [Chloroflexia bacterium]